MVVIASGFVEVNGINNVQKIIIELEKRDIDVSEVEAGKILFLMHRESSDSVKNEINFLRDIEDVKNVHLTYYSFENGKESL